MVKITSTLFESLILVENTIGERLLDSLSLAYATHRGGGPFIRELNSLTRPQLEAVMSFIRQAGYDVEVGPGATTKAIHRAITDVVASESSSSSASHADTSTAIDLEDDDDDDDDEADFRDPITGIVIRKLKLNQDDPEASERFLANQIGYRGHREEED